MSTGVKILIGVLVALILLGVCVIAAALVFKPDPRPEPTPTMAATAPATEAPPTAPPTAPAATETTEAIDDSWDKIEAAGKIVVGTAADYRPYEYYVNSSQIDGFDIALMDEIGRRLGMQVEYLDFAFDGLGNALSLGQIDAAIAAISVTPDREAEVDFSNVYIVGEDGILAASGSTISISSPDDLAGYRIGVQRGSVYEDWVQKTLVNTGLLPASNLFTYERADDSIRDLMESRIDLVVLDLNVAQTYASTGEVKLVGQGLNQQRLALALPKGAQALKAEIDNVLTALHNEGFISRLADRYLGVTELLPTPTPAPTSTAAPPPKCVDGLGYVGAVGDIGEGTTELPPGTPFTKIWRVLNTGTCTWDSLYTVVFADGNSPQSQMGGQPTAIQGTVAPGQTYDLGVDMISPLKPGTYDASWQLQNGAREAFGQRLRVSIRVPAAPTPTAAPSATPSAEIVFTVDRNQIKAGECVNFYWKVDNVREVYFYAEGERWQDHGVPGEGTRQECPPVTTTYYLRVVKLDGSVEIASINIYVEPAAEAPNITRFTVDPAGQITLDQCVMIRWSVEGAINLVTLWANDTALWEGAPTQGNTQDCPTASGTVAYVLEAVGPGGTSRQSQHINVVDAATATPVPTAAPESPVIYSFSVRPEQVAAGECVNIAWSVGGGTSYARILRNGAIVIDNAGFDGQQSDCLSTAGEYTYSLEAYNPVDEMVSQQDSVLVSEAAPENPLAGTRWTVTAYYDGTTMQQTLAGTLLSMNFGADGSLNGSAGCNTYSTNYTVKGSSITIEPLSLTSMVCNDPEGIMGQESAFVATLGSAAAYSLEAGQLYLQGAGGQAIIESISVAR